MARRTTVRRRMKPTRDAYTTNGAGAARRLRKLEIWFDESGAVEKVRVDGKHTSDPKPAREVPARSVLVCTVLESAALLRGVTCYYVYQGGRPVRVCR